MMNFTLVLLLAPFSYAAQSPLVGQWQKDGQAYAELRADGSGKVQDETVAWKADGKILTLAYEEGEIERIAYTIKGDTLKITMDGESETLTRVGGKSKAPPAAKTAAAGKDELSKLLVSSAWCHFRYNKVSGASHQERVVFRGDGSWGKGARGESYSSGAHGTVAGQSDSSAGGRWQARGGKLLMSEAGGELEDTGLSVSRNSNGYPILKSDGKEYSQCE